MTDASGDVIIADTPDATGTAEPALVLADGWVIDIAARDRLVRQLAAAPAHVSAVAAQSGELPPGSSYRVHAERMCLRPPSTVAETTARTARGAVLVRPGVDFEVQRDVVEVERGSLLIDPGAHVHDPWHPIGTLSPATVLGRPPFPRRPVVVFLGCEPESDLTDWARSTVNKLMRRDVEARVAMLEVAEGLHLTQPCLPDEESIRALVPDVIVTLDRVALDHVPAWCGTNRAVVAIEFTPDVGATAEIVSWRLGQARGQVRARVGRRVGTQDLVQLVHRLCAGPHPLPPIDSPWEGPSAAVATVRAILSVGALREPTPIPRPAARRSLVALTGPPEAAAGKHLRGLADHLVAAGHAAAAIPDREAVSSAASTADVAVISSIVPEELAQELLDARRRTGRVTVAHVAPADVVVGSASSGATPSLVGPADRLARSCGRAATPSTAVRALLEAIGVRAHLLPTLLTRSRAAELRSKRGSNNRGVEPIIGWHVGSPGTPRPDYLDAVVDAVHKLLAGRLGLVVEIVGDATHAPTALLDQPRVRVGPGAPGPSELARWTALLWTPPILEGGVADDDRLFVEASSVGVPTVIPVATRATIGGYMPSELVVGQVEQVDDWIVSLQLLIDDERKWSRRSHEAIRRSDALHGPAAAGAGANRFLGWALHEGASR